MCSSSFPIHKAIYFHWWEKGSLVLTASIEIVTQNVIVLVDIIWDSWLLQNIIWVLLSDSYSSYFLCRLCRKWIQKRLRVNRLVSHEFCGRKYRLKWFSISNITLVCTLQIKFLFGVVDILCSRSDILAKIYLIKVINKNYRKGVKYVRS